MLRFVQAKNLWQSKLQYIILGTSKANTRPCHLQFSVWRLLWVLGTRFHTHLVDMQISGSWWRPWRFSQSGARDATRLCTYKWYTCIVYTCMWWCRARGAARRVSTFTKWRGLPWEVECNRLDVKVSRSRTRSREPTRCTCDLQRSGASEFSGLETPSCRSATTWSIIGEEKW